MMIYKRAKAWEWSVGRGVWSGAKKRQTRRKEEGPERAEKARRRRKLSRVET